jgi:hypothetical protein
MKTHDEALDEAFQLLSEQHLKVFGRCVMSRDWDFSLEYADNDAKQFCIRSRDELVELHVVPTTRIGRAAWAYEVWPVFPNDGPGNEMKFASLRDAVLAFIKLQLEMKLAEQNQ